MTAIEIAERAVAVNARETERRYVRAMAKNYRRERNLRAVLGKYMSTSFDYGGSKQWTRLLIGVLGRLLHHQIVSVHPFVQSRIRSTRIALFGEILLLKRQITVLEETE